MKSSAIHSSFVLLALSTFNIRISISNQNKREEERYLSVTEDFFIQIRRKVARKYVITRTLLAPLITWQRLWRNLKQQKEVETNDDGVKEIFKIMASVKRKYTTNYIMEGEHFLSFNF